MAGNRTRINCLEGNYADHYTTIARCESYEYTKRTGELTAIHIFDNNTN